MARISCPYPGCKKYFLKTDYISLHIIYSHLRPLNKTYYDNDKYNEYLIAGIIVKTLVKD